MKRKDQEKKEKSKDPLAKYYKAGEDRKAQGGKSTKSKVTKGELAVSPETDVSPLSKEGVRLAISQPPGQLARQRIKEAAYVLKRSYPEISALERKEDWETATELLEEDYRSGKFLMDNLGADRYVDSIVGMTMMLIRRDMIKDMQIETSAEIMLLDAALMANFNAIKLQRMFGDLVTQVERELFHDDMPSVNLKAGGSLEINKYKLEEMLDRVSDKIMSLVERNNKMMVRNIKAIRDLRSENLSIRTEQLNIALQQVNHVVKGNDKQPSRGSSQELPEDSATKS